MSNNPFDTVIAEATALKEQARRRAEEAARIAADERAAKLLQSQRQRHLQQLKEFGEGFRIAVATRVVTREMAPEYIRQIDLYTQALLCQSDTDLPVINEQHARKIMEKFEYGLYLAAQRDIEIGDNFFFGQRLLAEQKTESPVVTDKLTIKPGVRPTCRSEVAPPKVDDLPPAITPSPKRLARVS